MASNITSLTIDNEYPVAGVDNDSQGFRDNFTIIKDSLAAAKAELSRLKAKAASDATALGVSELETKLDTLEEALGGLISPSTSASPPTITASQIKSARPS